MIFKELDDYRYLPEPAVISFSGGRTSAYQLLHIMEAYNGKLPEGIQVCFQNTGFEMPETLDFVQKVSDYAGVPIIWLERDNAYPYKVKTVDYSTAARKGEPFIELFTETVKKRRDGSSGLRPLPFPAQRVCTSELKIKVMHKYLMKELGWPRLYHNILGFRWDEESRVLRRMASDTADPQGALGIGCFPMFHAEADVDDVMEFWEAAPFDLGINSNAGNCDFCFMKSVWKIKALMAEYPERVQPWIDMEAVVRDRNDRFRRGRPSYAELFAEVQAGDMSAKNDQLVCGTCTD